MSLNTAAVRRSARLEIKRGAVEDETVENVWNLCGREEEFEKRESGEKRKRKRSSIRGVDLPAKEVTRMKKEVTKMKEDQKETWTCDWTLPALCPALEKVFSYLDWKDLGRAMLVCQRWFEVGGHPSLWTRFPLQLQLSGPSLKRFAKIRRLAWVKSVSVNLPKVGAGLTPFQDLLRSLPRLEELVINCNDKKKTRSAEISAISTFVWESQLRDLLFKLLLNAYWGRGQSEWRCQHGRDIENTSSPSSIWVFSAV